MNFKEDPQLEENMMNMLLDDAYKMKEPDVKEKVLMDISKREFNRIIIMIGSLAAAVVLSFITINRFKKLDPAEAFAKVWSIQSVGADYSFIGPSHIKIHRGELRLTSKNHHEITIETEDCLCVAGEGDFLIGFHQENENGDNKMKLKKLTRMLVLSGIVSLSASGKEVSVGKYEAAVVKEKTVRKIVLKTNNDFAFKLYKEINSGNRENSFFSPFSIMNTFAIAAEGARGKTAEEMGRALSFHADLLRKGGDAQNIPWEMTKLHTGIAKLGRILKNDPNSEEIQKTRAMIINKLKAAQNLNKSQKKKLQDSLALVEQKLKTYEFSILNKLWIEKTADFNEDYLNKIARVYNSPIKPVDFINNAEKARVSINEEVSRQTNRKVKNLIPPGELDQDTAIVAANTIYFKGDWLKAFKKSYTEKEPFQTFGKKITVDMMKEYYSETVKYGVYDKNGNSVKVPYEYRDNKPELPENAFEVLEMPYKGKDISMVILLPQKAEELNNLESKLSSESLEKWLKTLEKRKTNVYLPKFKSESRIEDFAPVLKKMGMKLAFTQQADLTGIATGNEPLYISSVHHKAFIEVNESGTEAAAASGFSASKLAEEVLPFYPSFKADRPFIYLIRDMNSGAVLFIGRMVNPDL